MEHAVVTLAVIVILGFAAYRITRALTVDSITDPARAVLYGWAWTGTVEKPKARSRFRGWVYELLTCSHCLGVWIAIGVVLVYGAFAAYPTDFGEWLIDVAAIAGVQSVLVSAVGRLEA